MREIIRQQATERALAFNQRQVAHIASIQLQQIKAQKRGVPRRNRLGTAVFVQTHDFAVQDCVLCLQAKLKTDAEISKAAEALAISGN